ncbi:hypothetical protein JCM8097_001445 [Rhodosporidiobolus ruineniae]
METLPDETVLRIGDFLENERSSEHPKDAHDAQQGLAALARASKRYHNLFNHLLFLCPILTSTEQGRAWLKLYQSFVSPFNRARLGSDWPPKVFKPEKLLYSGPTSDSIRTLSALEHLNLFSNLREIRFIGGTFANNFLPTVLAPGQPSRRNLRTLEISTCTDPDMHGFEAVLAFVLDVTLLENWDGELFRYDHPDLPSLAASRYGIDLEDENEAEDSEWWMLDEVYDLVHERAMDDFSIFEKTYSSMSGTRPFFGEYPRTKHSFEALTSLKLEILRVEYLYLLLYTSSFPSLRSLVFTSESHAQITPTDFQAMRLSITRIPDQPPLYPRRLRSGSPPKQPGEFLRPSSWTADEPTFLNIVLHTNFDHSSFDVPPLTANEIVAENVRSEGRLAHFGDGLRLDLLDCSKMGLKPRDDFE